MTKHPNPTWLKARARADRALFHAQLEFTRTDLRVRLGRTPTETEVLGWIAKNPLLVAKIKREMDSYEASAWDKAAERSSCSARC